MRLTNEEKLKMAKEANNNLTDKEAEEVVRDIEELANFALENFTQRKE